MQSSPKAFYDLYDYRDFWRRRTYEDNADRQALTRLLGELPSPRSNLLDVGCGFGRNALIYAGLTRQATLVDPSAVNLKTAGQYLKSAKNLKFVQARGEKLPFPGATFDTLICIRVLHHLPDPGKALGEFYRVLQPGGYLILEFANKLHAKARIKAALSGQWNRLSRPEPQDIRSESSKQARTIPFVNHHPETIIATLKKHGFLVSRILSVSNLRSPMARSSYLEPFLSTVEKLSQIPLAPIYFGPSIYVLARRPKV